MGGNIIPIIAQIIGFVAFGISCTRYFQKKRTTMALTAIVAYSFYITHYIMIGAFAGSYTLVLAIVRDFISTSAKSTTKNTATANFITTFLSFSRSSSLT